LFSHYFVPNPKAPLTGPSTVREELLLVVRLYLEQLFLGGG
jgi:hypothetical protein